MISKVNVKQRQRLIIIIIIIMAARCDVYFLCCSQHQHEQNKELRVLSNREHELLTQDSRQTRVRRHKVIWKLYSWCVGGEFELLLAHWVNPYLGSHDDLSKTQNPKGLIAFGPTQTTAIRSLSKRKKVYNRLQSIHHAQSIEP